MFCQHNLYRICRQESQFRISDLKPGTVRGSFLMPEKWHLQTSIPNPWWRVLDSGNKMGGVIVFVVVSFWQNIGLPRGCVVFE